jgi:hypothetical protein
MIDKLFPALMLLGFVSPIAAIAGAFIFYGRHCNRVGPERRMSTFGYVAAIVVCGTAGGIFGLFFGIEKACYGPKADNLCGLWGFFVTGPIFFAVAVLLVGMAVSSIRR